MREAEDTCVGIVTALTPSQTASANTTTLYKDFVQRVQRPSKKQQGLTSEGHHHILVPKATVASIFNAWDDISQKYHAWYQEVFVDVTSKTPTQEQADVLNLDILLTRYEHSITQKMPLTADLANMSSMPVYRLLHGLPRVGKLGVSTWLRSYCETVWQYTQGVEFVFVARMNSMADNIHGTTLRSYWKFPFQSKQGSYVKWMQHDEPWTTLVTKVSQLQWIFTGEIETADISCWRKWMINRQNTVNVQFFSRKSAVTRKKFPERDRKGEYRVFRI